jgi:hypothetical protein
MKCSCCFLDKPESEYYKIELGVVGQNPKSSKIVKEVCKDCIDVNDIHVIDQYKYHIRNTSRYDNQVISNYIKNELHADFSIDDLYSVKEMHQICLDRNIYTMKCPSNFRKRILNSAENKGFINLIKLPTHLNTPLQNMKIYMLKTEFYKYINLVDGGDFNFLNIKKNKLTNAQLDKLRNAGFLYGNEQLYIYRDDKNQLSPCKTCGEVKSFSDFRDMGSNLNSSGSPVYNYECLDCSLLKKRKEYQNLSPEKKQQIIDYSRQWQKENIEQVRVLRKKYEKQPKNRAARNVRRRLKDFLKTKDNNFSKDIGCTRAELVKHLESQFSEGMNWDNYGSGKNGDHVGSWHIDHIIPLSKFEGEYPNHYTNLQPMWGKENISWGGKIKNKKTENQLSLDFF